MYENVAFIILASFIVVPQFQRFRNQKKKILKRPTNVLSIDASKKQIEFIGTKLVGVIKYEIDKRIVSFRSIENSVVSKSSNYYRATFKYAKKYTKCKYKYKTRFRLPVKLILENAMDSPTVTFS